MYLYVSTINSNDYAQQHNYTYSTRLSNFPVMNDTGEVHCRRSWLRFRLWTGSAGFLGGAGCVQMCVSIKVIEVDVGHIVEFTERRKWIRSLAGAEK